MASRSLSEYTKQAWPVLEPAVTYLHNWHIDAIAEHLECCMTGQIKRLIINMPPRYMKSIEVSCMFPTWVWGPGNKPSSKWLFASYSSSLSTKHSIDRRTIMQSQWYKERWGDRVQFTKDQNIKTEYLNTARGHMIATSVGGSATGKGGDFVIVDDPVNPKEAQSEALRKEANEFFDQTLTTRLDNKKTGVIIIVMQRLHEKDLTGHVLKKQAEEKDMYEYVHLKLPGEFKKTTMIWLPKSCTEIVREKGDYLWPEREGFDEHKAQRRNLGSYGYAGQYDQDPAPEGGGIIETGWFNHYRALPPLISFHQFLISVDAAFKDKVDSDYVTIQVWGRIGAKKYLINQIRRKLSFTNTVKMIEKTCKEWPQARTKIIEDKANGSAIIDVLKEKLEGLIPVDPQGGKIARAHAVTPTIEAGDVYLPDPAIADWVDDFELECAKFPNSENDDQVDCMTQALMRLMETDFIPWEASVDWL